MEAQAIWFAAVAIAATLVVLAAVLRPLWREPGMRVASLGVVAGLGLATLALYALVGTPAALDPATRAAPQTLDAAIAQLEAQLQREPRSVEGWRLLGRTPLTLFDARREAPSLLLPGDEVRFVPIDAHAFAALAGKP